MSVIRWRERESGGLGAVLDKKRGGGGNLITLIISLSFEPTLWCFVRGDVTPGLAWLVERLIVPKYL